MQLSSEASIYGIKVKEITISERDYAMLINELHWTSRIKPTDENEGQVTITQYDGYLKVKSDKADSR